MTLRELFINWLTGSRFILSLESRLAEQRQDFTERLGEKNRRIQQLETEVVAIKIECDRMRGILAPVSFRREVSQRPENRPALVPAFPLDWQAELNRLMQEEDNGIRSEGREEVNQPSADDGA